MSKPKFLIEWGMHDHVQYADVIEADDLRDAIRKADDRAEHMWESNKIATAKPFKDKNDDRLSSDAVSSDGGVRNEHPSGRPAGGPRAIDHDDLTALLSVKP